jgi:hypothetical protein
MPHKPAAIALLLASTLATFVTLRALHVHGATKTAGSASWNPQQAAKYLDSREVWWQQWPRAQKDHGTVCISCHTTIPYALARPALQQQLHEPNVPATETTLFKSVETRVNRWPEMVPFYADATSGAGKTAQSHATEAVMNAILLTSNDLHQPHLSPVARTALNNAWAHGSPASPPTRAPHSSSSRSNPPPTTTPTNPPSATTSPISVNISNSNIPPSPS